MKTGRSTGRFEDLYREQGDRMWRALLAYSADPDIAADAVAEAFAQALRRGDEIREPARWVWRTAFRIAAGDLKERRARARIPPEREPVYEMEQPVRDLVAALASLSEKQRAAAVLHYAADYPVGEVAAILGSSPSAVKVHLARARARLRELLGDDDDG